MDWLLSIDRELFLFLNGLNTPFLDPVMYYVSQKLFWIPLYLLLVGLCVKHFGWKTILIVLTVALLIALTDQVTLFMKESIQRLRPSRDESLEGLVHTVFGYRGGRHGFVSSHAANTMGLAVFMIYLLGKKARYMIPVLIAFVALNSYSRIYLGVHYPGDIIGGLITGWIISLLVIRIYDYAALKTERFFGGRSQSHPNNQ